MTSWILALIPTAHPFPASKSRSAFVNDPGRPVPHPRNIVVTGSSSGIGRSVALRLASEGCDVIVHGCQNQAGAEETARLVRTLGRRAEVVLADLATDQGRTELLESCDRAAPLVSGWVHCAGVDVLTTDLRNAEFERKFDRLWEVDVRGTILLARAAVVRMRKNDLQSPAMVFVGWDQANQGMEGEAGQMFGPIKAAITSFAINLAQEVAPHIRVNVVAPGWIRTAWGANADPHWDQRARDSSLMERWGSTDDIANAIAFFLSPEAQFVTGQVLDINGGWNRKWRR